MPSGMGGESGESSGSSDDNDDNQYKDQGVEDATTKPTASLDAPMGGQAPLLPPCIAESVGSASRGKGRSMATSSKTEAVLLPTQPLLQGPGIDSMKINLRVLATAELRM